jgi:hypothetical protein
MSLLRSSGSLTCGNQDGFADSRIGSAPADIGHRLVNVGGARQTGFPYQRDGGHDLA